MKRTTGDQAELRRKTVLGFLKPQASSLKPSSGFTLLEIMIVMAIIGAIMAIAIPKFGSVFETNMKGAIRRFSGTVLFCFHESVIKQSVIRLNVDPVTGEYWPSILVTTGEGTGQFVGTDENIIKRAQLPEGIRFLDVVTPHDTFKKEEDAAFITFYPTGYVERTLIHLIDMEGRQYSLVIQPLTGDVEILDGYVDLVDTQVQGPFGNSGSSQ
jgi:general secretion pathway protein H